MIGVLIDLDALMISLILGTPRVICVTIYEVKKHFICLKIMYLLCVK